MLAACGVRVLMVDYWPQRAHVWKGVRISAGALVEPLRFLGCASLAQVQVLPFWWTELKLCLSLSCGRRRCLQNFGSVLFLLVESHMHRCNLDDDFFDVTVPVEEACMFHIVLVSAMPTCYSLVPDPGRCGHRYLGNPDRLSERSRLPASCS